MTDQFIQLAAEWIHSAKKIVVSTGAGVSKESGVPTFRDALDGLWEQYNPEDLATPFAFKKNPKLVWDWYEYRRNLARRVQPNPGHKALAEIEKRHPNTVVITQNVDDLHEQAGSRNVIHLHGNIAQHKCFNDCQGNPTLIDIATLDFDIEQGPPNCPNCSAHVRPNVVWFHEALPQSDLREAMAHSLQADLMIVIGTSGIVMPAAALPEIAKSAEQGVPAKIIEVNPTESGITHLADLKLTGQSGAILPQIIAILPS